MSREYLVIKLNSLCALVVSAFLAVTIFSAPALSDEKQINLVVFGDSLVAGFGLAPGEAFPEKLQMALNKSDFKVQVTNAGVSGDTTSAGFARLDWSIPDGTNAVILELGANDALRGIPSKITYENLDKMITRLKERNIATLLAGMLAPPNMGEDYAAEFNPIYKQLADKHEIALYPFFLEGVAGNPDLNQADAMHPTSKGIDVIVDNMMPTIEKFLATID